jgi:hypothetical protein
MLLDAFRPPDDGRKDARNMLRNNWLLINHYLLHLVGLTFIYIFLNCSKMCPYLLSNTDYPKPDLVSITYRTRHSLGGLRLHIFQRINSHLRQCPLTFQTTILWMNTVCTHITEHRHCTYSVTLRRVPLPFLSWKRNNYYIFPVCVCSLIYVACKAHSPHYTIFSSVARLALQYFSALSHKMKDFQ